MKHTDSNQRSTLERPERATTRPRPTLRVLTEEEKESLRRDLKAAVAKLMK